MNAADLHRATGTPTWHCPKDGGAMWYRPILSSGAHVCESCGWLAFDPARDGAIPASALLRAVEDDPYGLWRRGDLAHDLGWESEPHPDAPRVRVLRLLDGGEITPVNWRTAFDSVAASGDSHEPPADV